jgi:hypothetical protein
MSKPPIIDDLAEIVEEFRREIGYKCELRMMGPHHRYKYVNDPTLEVQFPHANEPGCYVFFADKDRRVLYVGKGSRYMGGRIWAPFGRQKRDGEVEPFPNAKPWVKEHKPGVWAIAVRQDHWWWDTTTVRSTKRLLNRDQLHERR